MEDNDRQPLDGIEISFEPRKKEGKKCLSFYQMVEYYSDCHKQVEGKLLAYQNNNYERKWSEFHAHIGLSGANLFKSSCICDQDQCPGSYEFMKNSNCNFKIQ